MNHPQTELRFFPENLPPGLGRDGPYARHYIGDLAGRQLPPALWNKGTDRESNLQATTCIRWRGMRGGFGLIGLGSMASLQVENAAPIIHHALVEELGGIVRVDRVTESVGIVPSQQRRFFKVSTMGHLARASRQYRWFHEFDQQAQQDDILRAVKNGLVGQICALKEAAGDPDAPTAATSDADYQHRLASINQEIEYYDLRVEAIGPPRSIPGRAQGQRNMTIHFDVIVSGMFDVSGHWAVGRNKGSGFGRLWYAKKPDQFSTWQEYLDHGCGNDPAWRESVAEKVLAKRRRYLAKRGRTRA